MKANELRIGNWVSYNGHPIMVRGTAEIGNAIYLRDIIYPINDSIQGIPITPEILEKAGFDKYGMYWVKDKVYIYEWGILDVSYHSHSIMDKDDHRVLITDLPYVHILQNYYFALTGQELNIEL